MKISQDFLAESVTSLGDKYERGILMTIQGAKEKVEKVMAEMRFSVDSINYCLN